MSCVGLSPGRIWLCSWCMTHHLWDLRNLSRYTFRLRHELLFWNESDALLALFWVNFTSCGLLRALGGNKWSEEEEEESLRLDTSQCCVSRSAALRPDPCASHPRGSLGGARTAAVKTCVRVCARVVLVVKYTWACREAGSWAWEGRRKPLGYLFVEGILLEQTWASEQLKHAFISLRFHSFPHTRM